MNLATAILFGTSRYNGFTKLIGDTHIRTPLMRNRQVFIEKVEQTFPSCQTQMDGLVGANDR